MSMRVIDCGYVSATVSQAIWYGVAARMQPAGEPALTLVNARDPYVCIGLHQDVRLNRADDVVGGVFVEDDRGIHRRQGLKHLGSLVIRIDWPVRRLALGARGAVAVDADDQEVAKGASRTEVARVPRVKDVEDAVREHNAPAFGAGAGDQRHRLTSRH